MFTSTLTSPLRVSCCNTSSFLSFFSVVQCKTRTFCWCNVLCFFLVTGLACVTDTEVSYRTHSFSTPLVRWTPLEVFVEFTEIQRDCIDGGHILNRDSVNSVVTGVCVVHHVVYALKNRTFQGVSVERLRSTEATGDNNNNCLFYFIIWNDAEVGRKRCLQTALGHPTLECSRGTTRQNTVRVIQMMYSKHKKNLMRIRKSSTEMQVTITCLFSTIRWSQRALTPTLRQVGAVRSSPYNNALLIRNTLIGR